MKKFLKTKKPLAGLSGEPSVMHTPGLPSVLSLYSKLQEKLT